MNMKQMITAQPNTERDRRDEFFEQELFKGLMKVAMMESEKINEGNNAIIKVFDDGIFPTESKEILKKLYPELFQKSEKLVAKILKIYLNGEGKKEFEMQKRAHEILADKDATLSVPRAYLYAELDIDSEEFGDKLLNEGVSIKPGGKIEVIIMDYVEGVDLATYIYRIALKHAQKDEELRKSGRVIYEHDDIDELSFKDLQSGIDYLCDFRKPGGNHHNKGEKNFEDRKVKSENIKKLRDFLIKNNLDIPEKVFEATRKSLKILHEQGFYHRDLHERNIMISNDSAFLIDFGGSIMVDDSLRGSGEIYVDKNADTLLVNDDYILNMWSVLARKKNVGSDEKELIQDLSPAFEKISNQRLWERFSSGVNEIDLGKLTEVIDRLAKALTMADDGLFYDKVRILLYKEIIDKGNERERVLAMLRKLDNSWTDEGLNIIEKLMELASNHGVNTE